MLPPTGRVTVMLTVAWPLPWSSLTVSDLAQGLERDLRHAIMEREVESFQNSSPCAQCVLKQSSHLPISNTDRASGRLGIEAGILECGHGRGWMAIQRHNPIVDADNSRRG